MPKQRMTFVLENHLCRACGGRILRAISGFGPTPGGNPVFKCADCGASRSDMGPENLCWCGYSHRRNSSTAYRCLPFSLASEYPALAAAFRSCGCDPGNGEVGIVLEEDYRSAIRR